MGSSLNAPIFVVGPPRSGTTLLRNMLNRHPDVAVCRETGFFHYVYSRRLAFGGLGELANRRRLIDEYLSVERVKRMRIDLDSLSRNLLAEATSYQKFFSILLSFFARAQGKTRCGEKTPHTAFLPALCRWYPDAVLIHILRDPRDVVASLQRMPWAANSVVSNARIWLQDNLRAARWRQHPGYLRIRYEELVEEPEHHLRSICAAAGIAYSSSMLIPKPDPTADRPWFHRAEEPVTTERCGRWRDQLSSADVALIEWAVGPDLRRFGYQEAAPPAKLPAIASSLCYAVYDRSRRWVGEFPGGWLYLTKSMKLAQEEAAKDRFRFRNLARRIEN